MTKRKNDNKKDRFTFDINDVTVKFPSKEAYETFKEKQRKRKSGESK